MHVLIVEDDAAGAQVLISHFQRLGIGYTSLYDSRKTVEVALGLRNLRIIFVDLEMPGADGYEVLNAIQSERRLARVPVVAYTAHLSQMANARTLGFHSFIGKPIRAKDFPAQIENILNDLPVWSVR
ncbi:MAG: response regulator [Anaerolineae bacterium]|nr:response regulator [Anaerolineae bacterium]